MRVALALRLAITALVLVLTALPSSGLYILIQEGHQRCFLEEVPPSTLVVGTYENLDYHVLESTPTQHVRNGETPRIVVSMLDPQGLTLASHMTTQTGKFSFTSQVGGEHLICVKSEPPTRLGRTFRFSFEVEAGDRAIDYSNVAKQEHLSAIEVEIRKLNDIISGVRQEQDYQRKREEQFRDATEGVNSKVVWWSMIQLVVLIVVGVSQTVTLKRFFKSKKNE